MGGCWGEEYFRKAMEFLRILQFIRTAIELWERKQRENPLFFLLFLVNLEKETETVLLFSLLIPLVYAYLINSER